MSICHRFHRKALTVLVCGQDRKQDVDRMPQQPLYLKNKTKKERKRQGPVLYFKIKTKSVYKPKDNPDLNQGQLHGMTDKAEKL